MRIKSYFASTVDEAMDKARRELGSEAMLMNSKRTEPELRSLGAYEVVFAVPPEAARGTEAPQAKLSAKSAPLPSATLDTAAAPGNDLVRELAELRKQIETVKRSVDRRPASATAAGPTLTADGHEILARLTDADLSEQLATEIALAVESRRVRESNPGSPCPSVEVALRAECGQRLRFAPSIPTSLSAQPRAVVVVGPAGAGKTTTLVKLALNYGLRTRLPLQFLSLDTLRIGGWEQLAAYSRIAGIPCQPVHTPAALSQAFHEYGQKKLLFIDTPGFSPADQSQSRNLAASLTAHQESVDIHLVLSAAVLPRVQMATIERFSAFTPGKLIFTHLDEVESPGPLLETALRSGLPLSFLTRGQQVPEDIDEASLDRVLGSLANGWHSSSLGRSPIALAGTGTGAATRRIASAA